MRLDAETGTLEQILLSAEAWAREARAMGGAVSKNALLFDGFYFV